VSPESEFLRISFETRIVRGSVYHRDLFEQLLADLENIFSKGIGSYGQSESQMKDCEDCDFAEKELARLCDCIDRERFGVARE
jgi:hypothetical protein